MSSIPYFSPKIYKLWLKIVDRDMKKQYQVISELIGKNKRVFELGCGPAFLFSYLKKGCEYEGWDLNKRFVNDAKKRGINVKYKDIFRFEEYPKSDVIVICDLLHHVFPKDAVLIKESRKRTKELIVVEPYKISRFSGLPYPIFYFYDKIIGDNDGINHFSQRSKWNFEQAVSLEDYFKKLGARKVFKVRGIEKILAIFKGYEELQD